MRNAMKILRNALGLQMIDILTVPYTRLVHA